MAYGAETKAISLMDQPNPDSNLNQKSNTSIRQEHLEQETRLVIGCFGKTISSPYLDRLRGKKENSF